MFRPIRNCIPGKYSSLRQSTYKEYYNHVINAIDGSTTAHIGQMVSKHDGVIHTIGSKYDNTSIVCFYAPIDAELTIATRAIKPYKILYTSWAQYATNDYTLTEKCRSIETYTDSNANAAYMCRSIQDIPQFTTVPTHVDGVVYTRLVPFSPALPVSNFEDIGRELFIFTNKPCTVYFQYVFCDYDTDKPIILYPESIILEDSLILIALSSVIVLPEMRDNFLECFEDSEMDENDRKILDLLE